MRVIAYDRVSTISQADGIALEQHHQRLKDAGAIEIYCDVESGFKKSSRLLNLEKVMAMVRSRSVDKVIVTRVDRICRRLGRLTSVLELFEESGVVLQSLEESIDLSTPAGRMNARLLAVFAEHHSDQKSEMVRAGRKYLRDNEIACVAPFAYIIDSHTRKHDWDYSEIILPTGGTIQKIELAKELIEIFFKVKSPRRTLRVINQKYGFEAISNGPGRKPEHNGFYISFYGLGAWLRNPVLRGHQPHKNTGIVHYNTHPDRALLTESQYQEIVQILKFNQRFKQGAKGMLNHFLSGLIYCDRCGSNCWINSGKRGKTPGYNYYYRCPKHNTGACPGSILSTKKGRDRRTGIRVEILEEAIVTALIQRADAIANIAATPSKQVDPPELVELKSQLAGLLTLGRNTAISNAIAALKQQILEFEQNNRINYELRTTNYELLIQTFSDPIYFKSLPEQDKRRLFHGLVEKVLIKDGAVVDVVLKV